MTGKELEISQFLADKKVLGLGRYVGCRFNEFYFQEW